MSLRFRQSFRIFPGVRVNVGKRGLSASIGVPGASMNVGRRGVRATAGLPGTGVSWTEKLGKQSGGEAPQAWTPPALGEVRHVRSAGIDGLTSPALAELHTLLADARGQQIEVEAKHAAANTRMAAARAELVRKQHSVFSFLHKRRIAAVQASLPDTLAEVEELAGWLESTHVDMGFETTGEAGATWDALAAAFVAASGCARIWDLTTTRANDGVRDRTRAEASINREPVAFALAGGSLIRFDGRALRLGNANGGDLVIYPGLVLIHAADGRFALVDIADLKIVFGKVEFTESEAIPADSEVVGRTWAKVNKDGSPDKRFVGNHQIPLVRYAMLALTSAGGLDEQWLFSDFGKGEAFVRALSAYQDALSK